jgi:hypothetical protein
MEGKTEKQKREGNYKRCALLLACVWKASPHLGKEARTEFVINTIRLLLEKFKLWQLFQVNNCREICAMQLACLVKVFYFIIILT